MKRWIHAATEPSSVEYGKALSEGNRRLNDRYEPFQLKKTFFNRGSVNSTGYRIILPDQSEEYIADNSGESSWSSSFEYKLYGPFPVNMIQSWGQLFANKPIASMKTFNKVMNWLFENVEL